MSLAVTYHEVTNYEVRSIIFRKEGGLYLNDFVIRKLDPCNQYIMHI